tara:strand:- start:5183 stop:5674 length:492 start_codon:yes stop_codon:yes gene_type:complete
MLRFKLKRLHLYILFGLVLIGCNDSVNSYLPPEETPWEKQTTEEKEALEALKQLELNTDIKNSIYLTLSNTNHNQLPSDSSFTISQESFRGVLLDYARVHHKNTPDEKINNWIEAAVKAQSTYNVYYCKNRSKKGLFKNRLPYSGTWILPNVLNTDIVLIWKR